MSKRNNENRVSILSQSVCHPSNQHCSFVYQLPDVVLKRKRDRKMPYAETYNGIVLFADVSGFTEMCEKYSNDVQRGVNQLANALNSYMAPIVEAILREKGDVYKFAGDAVLGLWPFENNSIEHKREQAKRVISCALYMKKSFCDYMTPIGTILNIKSAIATGSYSIIFLRGNTPACSKILDEYDLKSDILTTKNAHYQTESMKRVNSTKTYSLTYSNKIQLNEEMMGNCRTNIVNYYVCYGSAVVSVRNAEHQCRSQDIIIDIATWLLLDSDTEYIHEKFTAEHKDENAEIVSHPSNHQMEIIGQGPTNSITTTINKRFSPPNKNRDTLPVRKIISNYVRLYGRRNDISINHILSENHSLMSVDSIEPTDSNEFIKKPKLFSRNNRFNKLNKLRMPMLETNDAERKDFLSVPSNVTPNQKRTNAQVPLTQEESRELRPIGFLNTEDYDIFDLSTFIIKPVRNQESLDQLSELRLINICFLNIFLTDYDIKQLPNKLQTVIDCCAEQISITNGLLTKIFMFDKGLSLLCAFGLPGYKHPDDAERALKFAFLITQRLEKLNFVARVSTGVSTGQTFCGVLGHSLRCEYTVIGRKVNMAARLMVNYPGIVSCDDETYHKAHLDERYFELLPTVPLKGLSVSTSMRRYKGQDDDQTNMSVFVFPMINREDEWNIIIEYIEQVIKQCCTTIYCIFLTGSTGVGRSRLLGHINEELMYDTHNIRRVTYNASFEHVQLFGYTLKQIFKKLLYTELQESDVLLKVLKSLLPNHEKYLYLLRPYFDKLNCDVDKSTGILKRKMLEEIISELILNATDPNYEIFNYQPQPTIFIIDDAQYIDKESWRYIELLGSAPTSLVIMAMRDPTLNDDELQTRMLTLQNSSTTKHIQLMGLDNRYLSTLACQTMFVQRIPKDLEILITRKSDKGHPQNVIQLLSDLLSNQIIRIETITHDDNLNDGYVEGIQKYLWKRVVKNDSATGNIRILFEFIEPQLCRICDPDRNKFWSYTTINENINAHVKIDKLRDFEKRIAKISSLLTKTISKRVIVHAITNNDIYTNELLIAHQSQSNSTKSNVLGMNADLLKINSAFSQLHRSQLFECAWLDFEARRNPNIARLIHEKNMTPICCCPENTTKQIENCRMYIFKDSTLKEATLATIIDQFQHDYSSKIASFIESKRHLCKSCGGDSDSIIFLTPVQSMKLGMSILDTFHERKLKQLNQRLQNMIVHRFSYHQANTNNKSLIENFYHNFYEEDFNEKGKYFHELKQKIKQVDLLTKNMKSTTAFSPIAIGGRKDTIEGEMYAKIPYRLQENSFIQTDSPTIITDKKRSSLDANPHWSINNKKIYSKNNHCHQSISHENTYETNSNELLKRFLIRNAKNRFRLFKFRRKKSFNFYKLNSFNNNNGNQINIEHISEKTIEHILNRQWMKIFRNRKQTQNQSKFRIQQSDSLSYSIDSIDRNCENNKKIAYYSNMIYGINSSHNDFDIKLQNTSNRKSKRLLTRDIMSEAEHLVKHLHLSRQNDSETLPILLMQSINSNDDETNERLSNRIYFNQNILSIHERLYMNFTETCPLFLLKEGIDHRFEFLDFAPDLYVRHTFYPIHQDDFATSNNTETQIEHIKSTDSFETSVFSNNFQDKTNQINEIEYNQRNCRCNYLLVEIYRLLIKLWEQSSNIEKVLYYSLELARVELTRTNYFESKIILQNMIERLDREGDYLNLPSFFEPQIYDLLSESFYRMRKNDEAFLYVIYGLKVLNVQLIDFRSRDSLKLKSQCKQLRHTLIRTLIYQTINRKLSDNELIQRYFTGKLLFRAGQCARRQGQLLFAYFCVLNATLSLIQCHFILKSYEHCQSLTLLAELSHDLKRMEDCDLFVQANLKYSEQIDIGYETIAIKSNWLSMAWNLYRGKIDRALNHSYKIKDLLNKIGAYENLMSVATYSLQAALIGRREEVIRDLIDIIDMESNRPLKYENRLWSFILTLEIFVELNIDYDENLLDEIVLAIDYVLEHLEKKTSTPGDIHKFLTIVFYAQTTLVECYTKISKLDRAHQHYMRAIKFGMSLKEWTFRICNGMLKLAFYEIYECTKWLIETRLPVIPNEIAECLIISHMFDISKHFKLLRPRYLTCLALKYIIIGNHRSAKTQFTNAIRLANDLELDSERKHIETTRKQIFRILRKEKSKTMTKIRSKRTKD